VPADDEYIEKMNKMLDVLDCEGNFIMAKRREQVQQKGFWHRALNVWVLDMSSGQVAVGQRPQTKDIDPGKWTCVSGRIASGELSLQAAVDALDGELGLPFEESNVHFLFSIKCQKPINAGPFQGVMDRVWLDVYAACLDEHVPVSSMKLDVRDKLAVKWVRIEELQQQFSNPNGEYVAPNNDEYSERLFKHLWRLVREHHKTHMLALEETKGAGAVNHLLQNTAAVTGKGDWHTGYGGAKMTPEP